MSSMPSEVDVLIHNCRILTMSRRAFIPRGVIAIKDRKIAYVGRGNAVPKTRAGAVIDARGKVAMPGLVNCHTHVAMTLFRGVAEDRALNVWLKETIWPLEAKLTWEDVYYGALLGCLEMIRSGTTCFADMYFYEDAVAKAVETAGLRAVLAQGIIEMDPVGSSDELFKQSVDFAEKFHDSAEGRVKTRLAPHAVYSCSVELLRKVRHVASEKGIGIHVHVAESLEQAKKVQKEHGVSEVGFLEKIGFLGGDVLAAHCIFLSEEDMCLLRKRDVKVAYNPVANAKLGLAVSPVKELMDLNICVGLGTDGPSSNNSLDMFGNMKVAGLLQKLRYCDATVMKVHTIVEMATLGGARALGLEGEIGSLEVGKRADIILVDFGKPHLKPFHEIYANLVYSACGSDVDTVIVDGRILMENGEVKILDEAKVVNEAEKRAFRLINR